MALNMAARRGKNGQFMKSSRRRRTTSSAAAPRRRRSKPALNLINLAEGAIIANAITTGLGQANLVDFFTGRMDGKYKAGADGSGRLTLPELIKGPNISKTYAGGTLTGVLKHNFEKNGWGMMTTVFLTPVIARMAKNVLRKPVLNPVNKAFKMAGIKGVKV